MLEIKCRQINQTHTEYMKDVNSEWTLPGMATETSDIKTHHYGELLFIKYRPTIMVGIWCYNQSGATELLVMRDFHYGRMCFESVKTLGALHS